MATQWMRNAGLGLVLSTAMFAGGAVAQDKTSDQPNVNKQEGAQTNEQEPAHETETQAEGAPNSPRRVSISPCKKTKVARNFEAIRSTRTTPRTTTPMSSRGEIPSSCESICSARAMRNTT
ncbi:hypothetical protein CUR86_19625 [Salinicola acroporae]|uniref:Uncharacterized protein n=1 Tax=Salinicola acroporae TaxID=1541440 RepID=A0ABT6I9L9_9GAMM|nr:hypothetical protein [Salinicola acroporae]